MSKSGFESMIDSLVSKTKFVTEKMSSKANVAVESAKISFAISETEKKISELKEKIGDIIYNGYKDNKELDGALGDYCKMIENLLDDVEAMREKQAEVKSAVRCSHCGKLNDDKNTFCAECGEKLTVEGKD